MAVFAVIASSAPAQMSVRISEKILPQNYHQIDDKSWFVSAPESVVTPQGLSDFLGVSHGEAGSVIVLSVLSYYGYHSRNTWDWLIAKGV